MKSSSIKLLKSAGYKFILGGRIKKEERIVVSYSAKRAAKDAYNRKRGIERIQKAYKSGKVNKKNISQRGYNKFLKIENDVVVSIDYSKIKEDVKWDGWKSYVTNTEFKPHDVIVQYRGLWVVERAFRVSKNAIFPLNLIGCPIVKVRK